MGESGFRALCTMLDSARCYEITYGSTDDLGYMAADNVVHVHDFHATMLHLLGVDDKRLTCRFQGRDFRVTDVAGHVVEDILA